MKFAKIILTFILSTVFYTAFITSINLINNSTAQTYFFFYLSTLIMFIISLIISFRKKVLQIKLNVMDIIILLYVGYSLIRLLFTPYISINNDKIIELLLLVLFYTLVKYIFLHQSNENTINVLLIITGILLAACMQAFIGIFQVHNMFGFYSNYFLTIGTLGNPSHYSGFLTSILPFSFGLYVFTEIDSNNKKFLKYTGLICFLSIFMVLPLTKIRGDWIACLIAIIYILFNKYKLKKYFNSILNKIVYFFISLLFLGLVLFGLYTIRPDSALGRILIWKVSISIINENPIFGAGFDRYGQIYNNYQAKYFAEKNRDDREKYVADNVREAHNEYVQHFAELGILGFSFFILLLFYPILKIKPNIKSNLEINRCSIFLSAKASFIAITISSFFAFPFQVLPTISNAFLFLGILSGYGDAKTILEFNINSNFRRIVSVILLTVSIILGFSLFKKIELNKLWKTAFTYSNTQNYYKAINIYRSIYHDLNSNPDFLLNYGGTLSLAHKNENAIKILNECKKICSSSNLFISLGNSYQEIGDNLNAENNYRFASLITPIKLYPKYLLAKLYIKNDERKKAIDLANEILRMPVKVYSTAVIQIKQEMKAFINN